MSGAKPFSIRLGLPVAERLRDELAPYCERIEIAGSIRRRKPTVHDIEFVAIPRTEREEQRDLFGQMVIVREVNHLDDHLDEMLRATVPTIYKSRAGLLHSLRMPADGVPDVLRWGDRYKRFYFLWPSMGFIIPVDLFLADRENFGAIFTIRTGPNDFSTALVSRLLEETPYRQQEGYLVEKATGERVPVLEEKDYFSRAGVPWLDPWHRSGSMLRRVIRESASGGGA